MENLIFLAPAITAGILMSIVLGYFGNHILSRGIIFIDIAVAQIAALGTMLGLLLGFAEASAEVNLISYSFTLVIMALFGLTKFRSSRLPQEALIGIIYCVALGMALLLADRIPGGSNYINKSISGSILWTTWRENLHTLLLFTGVGLVLWFFRKQSNAITRSYGDKIDSINATRWHDVIFYIALGFVIVRSVPIAGIFMVFILLVAPAALAMLIT